MNDASDCGAFILLSLLTQTAKPDHQNEILSAIFSRFESSLLLHMVSRCCMFAGNISNRINLFGCNKLNRFLSLFPTDISDPKTHGFLNNF